MKIVNCPLKYKDGTAPKMILFTLEECIAWGGYNTCDFCNSDIIYGTNNNVGYIIPQVYGSGYAICKTCYKKFLDKGKLYEEDKDLELEKETIKYYSKFAIGDVIDESK